MGFSGVQRIHLVLVQQRVLQYTEEIAGYKGYRRVQTAEGDKEGTVGYRGVQRIQRDTESISQRTVDQAGGACPAHHRYAIHVKE